MIYLTDIKNKWPTTFKIASMVAATVVALSAMMGVHYYGIAIGYPLLFPWLVAILLMDIEVKGKRYTLLPSTTFMLLAKCAVIFVFALYYLFQ